MAQLEKAKVFMSGRSQAVRIPAQFRFPSTEVYIRRDPKNGDVIRSQSPNSLREIFDALRKLDILDDFLSPAERAHAQASQERLKGDVPSRHQHGELHRQGTLPGGE